MSNKRSSLFWLSEVTAILAWIACVIALVFLLKNIRTVMWSGWMILGFGILVTCLSLLARHPQIWILGLGHVGVCAVFVGLVRMLGWGPDEASVPFITIGTCYVVLSAIATFWVLLHQQQAAELTWNCEGCGYSLWGLVEPRCPECGRPFDPFRLRSLPPPTGSTSAPR